MKNNRLWMLATGILLAAARPAAAHDEGLYLGASAGVAHYIETCQTPGLTVQCDDKDNAWRAFGGYQFNRWGSLELGYLDLGKLRADAPGFVQETEITGFDLVGVVSFQVTNRLYLFGKLGGYRMRVATEVNGAGSGGETSSGFAFGLGTEYALGPIGIRAEFVRYDNVGGERVGTDNVVFYNASLLWRF